MKCEAVIYEKLYGDIITKIKFINEHFAKKWINNFIKDDDVDLDADIFPIE